MTEQEENEFHKVWDQLCEKGYSTAYEAARYCWVRSNHQQPVVELPKPELMEDADGQGRGEYIMIETIRRRLDAAGIKYTIRGDV